MPDAFDDVWDNTKIVASFPQAVSLTLDARILGFRRVRSVDQAICFEAKATYPADVVVTNPSPLQCTPTSR